MIPIYEKSDIEYICKTLNMELPHYKQPKQKRNIPVIALLQLLVMIATGVLLFLLVNEVSQIGGIYG